MSADQFVEVTVRFIGGDGVSSLMSLGKVDGAEVVRGKPARSLPTYRGQRNYPGLLWTATTQSLIGYESLLERDRLWLADFDPAVRWIASQPFWVSGRDGHVIRRHVPDFMLESAERTYTVVDVKPAGLVDEPAVAEVLAWTGRLCAAKGWRYEVWSGDDPVRLRNVRFLAVGRRVSFTDPEALVKVAAAGQSGMTLAQIEAVAGLDRRAARSAALSLLWFGTWTTDLSRPLSGDSIIDSSEAAA
jgi:hypothetical protein